MKFKRPKEWRNIIGYEGLYMISYNGKVKSFKVNKRGRLLRQGTSPQGYRVVNLWKDNEGKSFLVHRLVAQAFITIEKNKIWVNHIDNNPKNNHISNLEWCTPKENIAHAVRIGAFDYNRRPVAKYSLSGKLICVYLSATHAGRDMGDSIGRSMKNSKISMASRGERKSAYGYKWRYITKFEKETELILPSLDLRLGQFIFNMLEWLQVTKKAPSNTDSRLADTFHLSDKEFDEYYKEYLEELDKNK